MTLAKLSHLAFLEPGIVWTDWWDIYLYAPRYLVACEFGHFVMGRGCTVMLARTIWLPAWLIRNGFPLDLKSCTFAWYSHSGGSRAWLPTDRISCQSWESCVAQLLKDRSSCQSWQSCVAQEVTGSMVIRLLPKSLLLVWTSSTNPMALTVRRHLCLVQRMWIQRLLGRRKSKSVLLRNKPYKQASKDM